MFKFLSRIYLKITGWRIVGEIPQNITKAVLLFAPHTSYADFFIGRAGLWIIGLKVKLLIKKELFWFPLGVILKALGGIPVDRKPTPNPSQRDGNNTVEQIAEMLKQRKKMFVMVAPEGTRKRITKWKTGFYYIALQANVPILLCYLDYAKKQAGIMAVFEPTGDYDEDLKRIITYYKDITPKKPERWAVPMCPAVEG